MSCGFSCIISHFDTQEEDNVVQFMIMPLQERMNYQFELAMLSVSLKNQKEAGGLVS